MSVNLIHVKMAGRVLMGCIVLHVDAKVHMQEHFVKVNPTYPMHKKVPSVSLFQSGIIEIKPILEHNLMQKAINTIKQQDWGVKE